jgi:hypothetical protein
MYNLHVSFCPGWARYDPGHARRNEEVVPRHTARDEEFRQAGEEHVAQSIAFL